MPLGMAGRILVIFQSRSLHFSCFDLIEPFCRFAERTTFLTYVRPSATDPDAVGSRVTLGFARVLYICVPQCPLGRVPVVA